MFLRNTNEKDYFLNERSKYYYYVVTAFVFCFNIVKL